MSTADNNDASLNARSPPPVRGNASATNHPLAAGALSVPPPPPPPPLPPQPTVQNSTPVPPPPPLPKGSLQVAGGGAVTSNMDAMIDAFLLANSNDASNERLRPNTLPAEGIEKLRELVVRRNWTDVVTMAHDLLHAPNSYSPLYRALLHNPQALSTSLESHQRDVVEIMSLYAHALLHTSRQMDLCRLVDSWNFLEHVGGEAPEWIPASLHILGAACLQYANADDEDPTKATADALYAIRDRLSKPKDLWNVDHALVNLFIGRQKWRMVLTTLEQMRAIVSDVANEDVKVLVPSGQRAVAAITLQHAYDSVLLSTEGHVLLQAGASKQAQIVLEQAASGWKALENSPIDDNLKEHNAIKHVDVQLLADQGLWCFADGKFADALEFFRRASQQVDIVDLSYDRNDWVGFSLVSQRTRFDLYGQVLNNMACCALYTCRLSEAIAVLENAIRQNPMFLTERLAINLCTLYELASDTPIATRQKQTLQGLAQRFSLSDLPRSCFRLG